MSMFRIRAVLALGFFAISTSVSAVTINVNSTEDLVANDLTDRSPNTSVPADPFAIPVILTPTPGNGTPGACTLREAIMSANGDVATTPEQCYTSSGAQTDLYCPFSDSGERIAGECAQGSGTEPDEIVIFGGTILLDYALPPIKQSVRIVGQGFGQTVITGDPSTLARINPPEAIGTASATVDLPMFQVARALADSGQVTLEKLAVRGTRVHYFRSAAAAPALEADKRIINFGGISMNNGGRDTEPRKQLNLVNTMFSCNRRGPGDAVGGRHPDTVGDAGEVPSPEAPGANGGAVSVLGRAALVLDTVRFRNNVAGVGAGGAIFGGAESNHSPSLEISGANSVFDSDGVPCQDVVLATSDAGPNTNSRTACPGAAFCPASTATIEAAYSPGNIAGTAADIGAALPVGLVAGRNGGAIAIDATETATDHIGPVDIEDAQFLNSKAADRGGAVSLINVARPDTNQPAFRFNNVLFGRIGEGNQARGDGGALYIQGHNSTPANATLTFTSFGKNTSDARGGAIFYRAEVGAPVDFSMENVRFGGNRSDDDGGAIFAEDNTVDDSGRLNISKATFDGNEAIDGDGGAISCGATRDGSQITNVTFSGNVAENGGAIDVGDRCHLDINSSTITNNVSTFTPPVSTRLFVAAVADDPETPANETAPASVTYVNRGQGMNGGGGILVDEDSDNARVDVRNTIVAGNFAMDFQEATPFTEPVPPIALDVDGEGGADCSADSNAVLRGATDGLNFIGSIGGCGAAASRPFTAASGDPRLRLLTDNGGPFILGARNFTHLPESNSTVRDRVQNCFDGDGLAVTTDQRERFRTGLCDIGAAEFDGAVAPPPPTGPAVGVTTLAVAQTSVQLSSNDTTEAEMVRFRVTAPDNSPVTIKSIRVQPDVPSSGTPGSSSSVVGLRVYTVNAQGVRLQTLFTSTSAPALSTASPVTILFDTPLTLQADDSADISVTLVYGTSGQLAMSDAAIMLASGGAVGLFALIGFVGSGRGRWAAVVAAIVLGLSLSACDSDNAKTGDGGGGGGGGSAAKTFKLTVRQITFDAGSTLNVAQNVTVSGPTVTVNP